MYIHLIKGFRTDRKFVTNYGLYRQKNSLTYRNSNKGAKSNAQRRTLIKLAVQHLVLIM